jgi:GDP-D-mannose dehydratase
VIGVMVSACHTFIGCGYLINLLVAKDYVEGMWRMLQQESPEDFVLATGETHPVREFVEKSFGVVDVKIRYV